jgi:hypothetical protein
MAPGIDWNIRPDYEPLEWNAPPVQVIPLPKPTGIYNNTHPPAHACWATAEEREKVAAVWPHRTLVGHDFSGHSVTTLDITHSPEWFSRTIAPDGTITLTPIKDTYSWQEENLGTVETTPTRITHNVLVYNNANTIPALGTATDIDLFSTLPPIDDQIPHEPQCPKVDMDEVAKIVEARSVVNSAWRTQDDE